MTDPDTSFLIGTLKARCMILESQMAALTAFTCAILETHPRRDEMQTRWSKHLGPALERFSSLSEDQTAACVSIPAWVAGHLAGEIDQ